MKSANCYAGRVLRVDLTSGTLTPEPLNEAWAADFIGGKGLAFRYLTHELAAGVDPLSPGNVVAIFPGALAGTVAATTARTCLCTRSPATGTICDSYVGGGLGAVLKYAGWDGIILTGRAPSPVYLCIRNGQAELRDAAPIWGQAIWPVETWLEAQAGPGRVVTLTAGPAGENLVPFACLTSEAYRHAGRGGLGAVFGSKNLKAIAVHGSGAVRVPDMAAFMATYKDIMRNQLLTDDNLWANAEGTPIIVSKSQRAGLLPTRGYSEGTFDGVAGIDGAAVLAARERDRACTNCPLACGKLTHNRAGEPVEGPEYETIGLGGSNCGIDDLSTLITFNRLCDNLGLDTISTGNVIGLAMTMAAQGIHDFGLRYGDGPGYLRAVEEIAARRGVGAELALGARELARRYGAEALAMETKGLEYPAYDPRGAFGMGLAYATSDRGACHLRSFVVGVEALDDTQDPDSFQGKAAMVIHDQDYNSAKWTGIFCDFWAIGPQALSALISAGTGRSYSPEEMLRIGERIWNLGRLFNVREGFRRGDDYLPAAVFDRPLPAGQAAGKNPSRAAFQATLDEYYRLRGWDADGVPTPEKLAALGLDPLG